jgi:WD40 repeat protein/tRNA A-37 threonylcarbamoyl transferase component Bud32
LLEEIARGGMGVVYRARQISLGREVAIKMILAGERAGKESLQLFQREAYAAANLHHPNIVPVFEIGEHETQHYFTMRFVRGGRTIADWAAERRNDYRAIARTLAQAARAVVYAHSHGVLHRDLKPSNILWDAETGPQLTDFGLAKLMDAPASDFTLGANAIGSPGYMAPEQAEGRVAEITTATDVYGLGTVLYEMLSGRAPFAGGSLLETIRRAAENEPEPLPSVPKDLRTICFKCLAKRPADRYRSAASLADDLERFARGEPVSAVPLAPMQTAWRWARRHPAMAGMLAMTSAVVISGVAGITWQWHAAVSARRGELEALQLATDTVVDLYTHSGINAAKADDPSRAALWFAQAANVTLDATRQAEELRRQMAWRLSTHTCVRAFESGVGTVGQVRWNAAQTALITQARQRRRSAVWELATERRWQPDALRTMELAVWANHTNWIALSTGARVVVAEFPSAREIAHADTDTPATVLAVSPEDRWIAVGSSTPFLWEVASGKKMLLPASLGVLGGLEFSRNGRYLLLTGSTSRGVCALSAPGEFLTPPVEAHALASTGFLGDGETYFSTTPRGKVKVYETSTGRQLESYPTSSDTNETVAAVSPDGHFLARHSQPLIQRSGEALTFPRHKNRFEAVDFSADGKWLLTGSYDTTVQVWALGGNGTSTQVGWHQHGVTAIAFSPDQRLIAAAQYEGSLVRIWRLAEPMPSQTVPIAGDSFLRISSDGRLFVPSGHGDAEASLRLTRVYDTTEAKPVGPELDPGGAIMDAEFAPDGAWLAILCATGSEPRGSTTSPGAGNLQFWDYRRGERLGEPIPLPARTRGLSVHPSGDWVGLYDAEARLSEVNVRTRAVKVLATLDLPKQEPAFGRCAYSPDGSLLVGWGLNQPALFWDRRAGQRREPAVPSAAHVMDVAFHRNVVATVPLESRIDFLSVPDLVPVVPPIQDSDWLFVGRFSGDGEHFLSGGRGSRARIWNWRQGALLCPALQHDHEVFGATFIPATPWVATGDISHHIRFWNHETGLPVRPPLAEDCKVMQLVATPDGRSLLRANIRGQGIRLYRLADLFPPATLPAKDALLLGEIDAAAEVLQGGLEPLSAASWLAKWREFRARQPEWHRW